MNKERNNYYNVINPPPLGEMEGAFD